MAELRMHNPPHPGEVLRELYMGPMGLTVAKMATVLRLSRKALSQLVNGHTRITPETALRLSMALDNTPESWLNLQQQYDLWQVRKKLKVKIPSLKVS